MYLPPLLLRDRLPEIELYIRIDFVLTLWDECTFPALPASIRDG